MFTALRIRRSKDSEHVCFSWFYIYVYMRVPELLVLQIVIITKFALYLHSYRI